MEMTATLLWSFAGGAALAGLITGLWVLLRGRSAALLVDGSLLPGHAAAAPAGSIAETTAPGPSPGTTFADERLERLLLASWGQALDLPDARGALSDEGAALSKAVLGSMRVAVQDRRYFPRRPMVIPQLLKALRSDDSGKKELVEIVMQDTVMTGDVLRMANSALYRRTTEPVDNLGRAIMILGHDGLRSVVSASALQPVFRVPPGAFQNFSTTLWNIAQTGAVAAQRFARRTGACDSFSAHLAVLLASLGPTVLFRQAMDVARERRMGEVSAREMMTVLLDHSEAMSLRIVKDWDLPASITRALHEQLRKPALDQMSPLGLAVYYGHICGMALSSTGRPEVEDDDINGLLVAKGMLRKDIASVLNGP